MTILATILIALGTIPMDRHIVRETVDMIEVNHYYDCEGSRVFVQEIVWEFQDYDHRVTFWRMHKDASFEQRPPRLTWVDGNRVRQVTAGYWRETHSQVDPETEQRELLPETRRKGLAKP